MACSFLADLLVGVLDLPLVVAELDLVACLLVPEGLRREHRLLLLELVLQLLEFLFLLGDIGLLLLDDLLEFGLGLFAGVGLRHDRPHVDESDLLGCSRSRHDKNKRHSQDADKGQMFFHFIILLESYWRIKHGKWHQWLRVMRNKIYSKFPYAFSLTP